jgi:hypothetical protein
VPFRNRDIGLNMNMSIGLPVCVASLLIFVQPADKRKRRHDKSNK